MQTQTSITMLKRIERKLLTEELKEKYSDNLDKADRLDKIITNLREAIKLIKGGK